MKKILVTGATGMLGSSLISYLKKCDYTVLGIGNSKKSDFNIDLTNCENTVLALDQIEPDVIVNLVALTNVDLCQSNQQLAYTLNVKVVENLICWLKKTSRNCHLLHISTDQVYDGIGPHHEDQLTILNSYAMSKYAGELAAAGVPSTILRTNFVGRSQCKSRKSLSDWLFEVLIKREKANVFSDIMFSPISISSLCFYIEKCILKCPAGIFNLGSKNGLSKADFAFSFANTLGLPTTNLTRTLSIASTDFVAQRPLDMRMNCERFERVMALKLPSLLDEIKKISLDYK